MPPKNQPVKKKAHISSKSHSPQVKTIRHENASKKNYWIFAIAALTIIAFAPAFKNEFTNWDDEGYVVNNLLIRNWSFEGIKKIFSSYVEGNYHPLTMLSLAIEYQFVEVSPTLYHVTNVIIHALNSLLVFWFIRLLTGKLEIAGITAILFGIHPMHVESVAWVSERKDVLYSFFFLAALVCYINFSTGIKRTKNYVIALILFLLSLLSKGQAVTLPVVFLLVDFYRKRPFNKQVIIEKIPFFLLSVGFGVLAVIAQKSSNAIQDNKLFTFFERILFASYGMLVYIIKVVVPYKLSCFYPYPFRDTNGIFPYYFYLCPIAVALIFFAVYKTYKYSRKVIFGFLFFLVTIALVLQVLAVGSTIMADRYSYLPYIGLFFLIGCAYNYFLEKKPKHLFAVSLLLSLYAVAMVVITRSQCLVWRNSLNLWNNVIEHYPMVPVAYNNKGLVYKIANNYGLAIENYNKALEADAAYQGAYENRGNIYFLTGKYEEAIKDFNKALSMKPLSEVAWNSRGAVYFNQGRYDEALFGFNKALEIKPDYPEVYRNRGNVYSVMGKFKEAIEDYNVYLKYDKKLEMIYYWRGLAYYNTGQMDNAIRDFDQAIRMKPHGDFYFNRSRAYQSKGDFANALRDAESAVQLGIKVDPAYLNSLRK